MKPMGKQCASGLSLLLSARRFFTSSAAQGWIGRPPCTPVPTSRNKLMLAFAAACVGALPDCASKFAAAPRAFCQMPDRSGLPSAVRGGGAVRSGFPSAFFGILAAGYGGHWANIALEVRASTAVQKTARNDLLIQPPVCEGNLFNSAGECKRHECLTQAAVCK